MTDELADVAQSDRNNRALQPLTDILNKHHATLVNQFDAFEKYVTDAEKEGPENFPLYKWTKATVEDAKYIKTFALHVRPLVGGELVTRMSKHDTNPANNLQVPPEYRS